MNGQIKINIMGGLMNKRKIVTLCGSTKFWKEMQEINEKISDRKWIRSNWTYTSCYKQKFYRKG